MDLHQSERYIRQGVILGIVLCVLGSLLLLILPLAPGGEREGFSVSSVFISVVIIAGLTFGLSRGSRVCAFLMVGFLLLSVVGILIEGENRLALLVQFVFLLITGRAAAGTVVSHRLLHSAEPRRPRRRLLWLWIPLGIVALIVMFFIALGALAEGGFIPTNAILRGDEIHPRQMNILRENGLVNPGEQILYLYSDAFFSILAQGNFFTEDRVVIYGEYRGETYRHSIRFGDIEAMWPEYTDSSLGVSHIIIVTCDGWEYAFLASAEDGGDRVLWESLQAQWRRHWQPQMEGMKDTHRLISSGDAV